MTSPLCVCGHTRNAHHGPGPCLVALLKSKKAEGKVSVGSVCPCTTFTPVEEKT